VNGKTKIETGAGNSTVAHTPGPWFHIPRARDGHVDIITDREDNRGRAFIQVGSPEAEYPILDYPHDNKQTANARLIAAAPELLAALKELAGWGLCHTSPLDAKSPHNLLIAAVEAIAKAEGRAE
jgi:hypothetical protein